MAFQKKIWKNRISEFFNRYRLENVKTGEVFNAYINLNDGAVEEEGDKINADTLNDLEDRIVAGVGKQLDAQTLAIGNTTLTFTDTSITTNSTIEEYYSIRGVSATDVVVTNGQAVMTFDPLDTALSVYLIIK